MAYHHARGHFTEPLRHTKTSPLLSYHGHTGFESVPAAYHAAMPQYHVEHAPPMPAMVRQVPVSHMPVQGRGQMMHGGVVQGSMPGMQQGVYPVPLQHQQTARGTGQASQQHNSHHASQHGSGRFKGSQEHAPFAKKRSPPAQSDVSMHVPVPHQQQPQQHPHVPYRPPSAETISTDPAPTPRSPPRNTSSFKAQQGFSGIASHAFSGAGGMSLAVGAQGGGLAAVKPLGGGGWGGQQVDSDTGKKPSRVNPDVNAAYFSTKSGQQISFLATSVNADKAPVILSPSKGGGSTGGSTPVSSPQMGGKHGQETGLGLDLPEGGLMSMPASMFDFARLVEAAASLRLDGASVGHGGAGVAGWQHAQAHTGMAHLGLHGMAGKDGARHSRTAAVKA